MYAQLRSIHWGNCWILMCSCSHSMQHMVLNLLMEHSLCPKKWRREWNFLFTQETVEDVLSDGTIWIITFPSFDVIVSDRALKRQKKVWREIKMLLIRILSFFSYKNRKQAVRQLNCLTAVFYFILAYLLKLHSIRISSECCMRQVLLNFRLLLLYCIHSFHEHPNPFSGVSCTGQQEQKTVPQNAVFLTELAEFSCFCGRLFNFLQQNFSGPKIRKQHIFGIVHIAI